MSARSWMGLLIVFVAVFAGIAYWSYSPSPEPEGDRAATSRRHGTGLVLPPPDLEASPFHPRILYTYRTLRQGGGLRELIAPGGRLEETFRYMRSRANRCVGGSTPVSDLPAEIANARLRALALCHLADPEEKEFGRKAVGLLIEAIDDPAIRNPEHDWKEFPVTEALVFDWCHDVMDPLERELAIDDMAKRGTYIAEVKNATPPQALSECGRLIPLAFLGLALAGEEEVSERAERWLALFRESFVTHVLRPRFRAVGDGSGFALGDREPHDEIAISRVLRAWKLALDEDLAALAAPGVPPKGAYPASSLLGWLGSISPDFSSDKCAASSIRRPPAPAELFYELAALSGDHRGSLLGDRVFEESWNALGEDDPGRLELALSRILSAQHASTVGEIELPSFSVFWLSGLLYHRGTLPDGAPLWLAFRAGNSPRGDHFHQNHISIMRGNDHLAIDAGYPPASDQTHGRSYSRTPFAHNTVVLADLSGADEHSLAEYSPGKLAWHYHDETISAGIGRVTIASPSDKAEFIRTVAVLLNRYIVICDAVLLHRAPGKAVWMMHSLDAPAIDGDSSLLEGKRAGGISESTNSKTFTITSGASALILRTLAPANPIMRVVGGTDYEFRAGAVNYPPGTQSSPVRPEALRQQLAGSYRIEIEHDRPSRRLLFLHLGVCGPREEVMLPEIERVEDQTALRFYVRDKEYVIEIAVARSGQRMNVTIRDRTSGATINERALGEAESR